MSALRSEFSHCEVYSIDEAFFDISDTYSQEDITEIRALIIQKTGIPDSIGVAKTKTLAKVGSVIAKKVTGVHMVTPESWKETAKITSCGSIWGIGRQTSAALSRLKIYTVSDLLEKDATFIKNSFGIVGERLMLELQGIPVYTIGDSVKGSQETYTSTRSFGASVRDKETLREALRHHVTHIAEKLRGDQNTASIVTVMVRSREIDTEMIRSTTRTMILNNPTYDTVVLLKAAMTLLDQMYTSTSVYKKTGVILSQIRPYDQSTGSLFSTEYEQTRSQEIHAVTDQLNNKFGSGAVRFGGVPSFSNWHDKKEYASKHYTTKWTEIPTVKAIEDMSYMSVSDRSPI